MPWKITRRLTTPISGQVAQQPMTCYIQMTLVWHMPQFVCPSKVMKAKWKWEGQTSSKPLVTNGMICNNMH